MSRIIEIVKSQFSILNSIKGKGFKNSDLNKKRIQNLQIKKEIKTPNKIQQKGFRNSNPNKNKKEYFEKSVDIYVGVC